MMMMMMMMMKMTMMLLVVEGVVGSADDDVDDHDDDDDDDDVDVDVDVDDHDVILNIVSRDFANTTPSSALAAATRTHICGCRMAWLQTHLILGLGRSCTAWKALNDNLHFQMTLKRRGPIQ